MITKDDVHSALNGKKVILLLEQAPLTDKFAQVMLTQEEFKSMSHGLFEGLPSNEDGSKDIITRDTEYVGISLPNIPPLYSAEQKVDPKL